MNNEVEPIQAILLLGPTGAGKTPLGQWLERQGVFGGAAHHFDFGANLRAVVAAGPTMAFSAEEIAFLQRVLSEGALLEQESLHLAIRILEAFLSRRRMQPGDWLVLNGLPRHVGQAQSLVTILAVKVVAQLECNAATIRERLNRDVAGDRAGRVDDHAELVERKLSIYEKRSRPLIEHYREQGARILKIKVEATTRPQDICLVQGLGPSSI